MNKDEKKARGRFLIVFFMGLFVAGACVWSLKELTDGIQENSVNVVADNNKNADNEADKKIDNNIDCDALVKKILSDVKFETTLNKIDKSVADGMINVQSGSIVDIYMGSGSFSDELIVVKSSDEKNVETDRKAVESYLKEVKKSFEAYIPEQAKKISDAVIAINGCYVIACVTSDKENASAIILSEFKTASTDKKSDKTENDEYKKIKSDGDVVTYNDGTVLIGNTAYEQYNYVEDASKKYVNAVNNVAKNLENVNVYDMIIPTSIAITLPDDKYKKVGSSDQKKAIKEMSKIFSEDVKVINIYDELMKHRTEYIYYRTDHHWTSLGAYYAYNSFCKVKGIEPGKLEDYKKNSFGKFLGSFYTATNKAPGLLADEMEVLYPINNDAISTEYTEESGQVLKGKVIEDASSFSTSLKYCTFIDGDNPYTIIKNKNIKDNSSCVVIKESFGNAFVPFLADNYSNVYVIDYRYWQGDIKTLVKEKKASDVIFANNISMTRNTYLIGKLNQLLEA